MEPVDPHGLIIFHISVNTDYFFSRHLFQQVICRVDSRDESVPALFPAYDDCLLRMILSIIDDGVGFHDGLTRGFDDDLCTRIERRLHTLRWHPEKWMPAPEQSLRQRPRKGSTKAADVPRRENYPRHPRSLLERRRFFQIIEGGIPACVSTHFSHHQEGIQRRFIADCRLTYPD